MVDKILFKRKKIGIIGVGNMGQTILHGLLASEAIPVENVFIANRTPGKIKKIQEKFKVRSFDNNEELIDFCDVVIIAVKPQDFSGCIENIAGAFTDSKIVISLAAGITAQSIQNLLPAVTQIIRVMPSTPAKIGKGVIGYTLNHGAKNLDTFIESILSPLGYVIQTEEGELFEALTVSCSSGVGFVFEFMQYWQEWLEEHGFEENIARKMTVQTFLGAAMLADKDSVNSIEELQNKVVSKKGVTSSGLSSIREMEIERSLRYSFEKAVLRDRELGKQVN
ncbi:MAG: pyrroline-5-carboxylate reductase [Bdellovibrionaceae bacterium]|nr:pyrroline-5-carboxylate reductase [Pseudobdellovibrionaceae bacterium]